MPPLILLLDLIRGRSGTARLGFPPFFPDAPLPAIDLRVFGVTKDAAGAPLGNCMVDLFTTVDDVRIDQTLSDANGVYEFRGKSTSFTYYVVAYKAGTPDVSGTTVNTLVGS